MAANISLETLDPKLLLGGAIAIIILAAILTSVSYLTPQPSQTGNNVNQAQPQVPLAPPPTVQQLLSSGHSFNISTLLSSVSNQITAADWFNVTYLGRVNMKSAGVIGVNTFNTSVNMTIIATYMRLNGSSKSIVTVENGSLVGNVSAIEVKVNSSVVYSCYKYWLNPQSFNNINYTCAKSLSGTNVQSLLAQGFYSLPELNLTVVGRRTYDGMPCILATTNSSPDLSTCVSTTYNVPLYMSFALLPSHSTNVSSMESMNAVIESIGVPVTKQEVVSLPGPVAIRPYFNYTFRTLGNTTSLFPTGTCTNNAISGFTCSSPTVTPFSTITFLLKKQSTGTAYNLNAGCILDGYDGNVTYYPVGKYGFASSGTGAISLSNGESTNVTYLKCLSMKNTTNATLTFDEPVNGTLYVRYTDSGGQADNTTNPWQTSEIGTFSANAI